MGTRLEDLKDQCRVLNCNVASEKNLGHLLKHWDLLQWRLDMQKSRVAHTETQWLEIKLRVSPCKKETHKFLLLLVLLCTVVLS